MMIILVRTAKTASTSTLVEAVGSGLLALVYKGGCSRATTRHGYIIHRTVICSDESPSTTNFMSRSYPSRCMSSDASSSQLNKEIDLYSKKKQTSVSLRALMESGQGLHLQKLGMGGASNEDGMKVAEKILIQIACFLHRELPVRVAHRAVKLEASPLFMKSVNIQNVCSWYKTSFGQLRSCPVPSDREKEELFAKVIESVYERHSSTLIAMAKGAHELRNIVKQDVTTFADSNDIQKRLDEFYMSRIGIRMLIGQYLALRKMSSIDGQMVGLISLNASPYEIASQAARDAAYVCIRTHGDAPEVIIHGRTDLTFPYVSSHLSYMLLELLKNSMRATVETHGIDKMPSIKIVIADGEDNEDVVLKVSDEGGGIKRSNIDRIWSYLYTTAHPSVLQRMLDDSSNDMKDFDTASPLAGLGYGLPISRNYARIFDGDLKIMSMEGYGTDSFIYLPRLGSGDSARV